MSEMSPQPTPLDQPAFDPAMFPATRRPLRKLILDHNPCLLLSTVLMLLGCYLINSAIDLHAADSLGGHAKLISLIVVTNLYEACIIPLGLILIRRSKGTARDGLWLLLFEALFMVNGTFMNVEPSPVWGWSLNIVLLIAALIKAAVIFRGLGLGLGPRTFGFLALQLGIIYCLPIAMTRFAVGGYFPRDTMYALYWMTALLPVAYDLLARLWPATARYDLAQQVIRRTYLIAPWLLLVVQLGFSHWAHHSEFALADVGPLLFGVTIAAGRVMLPTPLRAWILLLPIAAVFLSINAPEALSFPPPLGDLVPPLTPLLFATCGMLVTYSYLFSLWAALITLTVLFLAEIAYALRHHIYSAMQSTGRAADGAWDAAVASARIARSLIPTTAGAWGVLTVIAAFVLLILGGYFSLRRTRDQPGP